MANYQSTHTGAEIDAGVDKANKALVKPDSAPSSVSLAAVDNSNAQTMLAIGNGLSVENGALKATGGTKLYNHIFTFDLSNNTHVLSGNIISTSSTPITDSSTLSNVQKSIISSVISYKEKGSDKLIAIGVNSTIAYNGAMILDGIVMTLGETNKVAPYYSSTDASSITTYSDTVTPL